MRKINKIGKFFFFNRVTKLMKDWKAPWQLIFTGRNSGWVNEENEKR